MRNFWDVDCTGWTNVHPDADIDMLGVVPRFVLDNDPRPAAVQFNERYEYGGWSPIRGFVLRKDRSIKFPEDPPLHALLERKLRDETITYYGYGLFMITQPDGTWEIARMD